MGHQRENCRINSRRLIELPHACTNRPTVAERLTDISQPRCGWYGAITRHCPERTTERIPASLQDAAKRPQFPATLWLANFHRHFATNQQVSKAYWPLDFGPWTLDLGPWTLDFGPLDCGVTLFLLLSNHTETNQNKVKQSKTLATPPPGPRLVSDTAAVRELWLPRFNGQKG